MEAERININHDKVNMEIGERLTNIRLFLGFTKEQMAEKLNESAEDYDCFEKGTKGMHSGHLGALFSLTQWADPDYLLMGKHSYDHYIEEAIRKMPEEEYTGFIKALQNFADRENDVSNQEILEFYDGLAQYGKKHMFDKDIRESGSINVFTVITEEVLKAHAE